MVAGLWLGLCGFGTPCSAEEQTENQKALEKHNSAWFIGTEGHFSLLSDSVDRSVLGNAFGYGLNSGYRWGNWGLFGHVEHNLFVATEFDRQVVNGALNIGLGGEYFFHDRGARTSLTLGPSILLFDTLIDDAGETGFFIDIRPGGLRWHLGGDFFATFDPLTFGVVAPVVGSIPLVNIEYRTIISVEYCLVE